MNRQNFKNANGMFPVTTETFDFMQEQILMLGNLARIAGHYMIVKPPKQLYRNGASSEVPGLVIIAGELMPLRVGDGLNAPYVEIVEESEDIMVNETSFSPLRTRRYARFTNTETEYVAGNLSWLFTNEMLLDKINKQAQMITELQEQLQTKIEDAAKNVVPKGTIIDWSPENIQFIPSNCPKYYFPCFSLPKATEGLWNTYYEGELDWEVEYSGNMFRFKKVNGLTIPDLKDCFTRNGTPRVKGGAERVTLKIGNLPPHNHPLIGTTLASGSISNSVYTSWVITNNQTLNGEWKEVRALRSENVGSGESFSILPPYMEVYKLIKVI